MSTFSDAQISAATAVAGLVDTELQASAITRVQCCARMAGTFLFRSYSHALSPQAPGTVLRTPVAGHSGPALVGLLETTLQRLGITVDSSLVNMEKLKAGEDEIGFLAAQKLLEPLLTPVKEKHGLSYEAAAQACAVATALLIKKEEKQLDVETAVSRAIYAFIEGSKTVPAPLTQKH
ncbi:MAG: hypothetical protein REI12_15110 [Pedobacter sp.]|nr:hypothetical protein [Pedobacter sp.]